MQVPSPMGVNGYVGIVTCPPWNQRECCTHTSHFQAK